MPEKIVTFEIDNNGDFTVETEGFQGKGCQAIHDAVATMGKVTHEELKPEFYQGPGNNNTVSNGR